MWHNRSGGEVVYVLQTAVFKFTTCVMLFRLLNCGAHVFEKGSSTTCFSLILAFNYYYYKRERREKFHTWNLAQRTIFGLVRANKSPTTYFVAVVET